MQVLLQSYPQVTIMVYYEIRHPALVSPFRLSLGVFLIYYNVIIIFGMVTPYPHAIIGYLKFNFYFNTVIL